MTTSSITSGQEKQIIRFTEDAATKAIKTALTKVSLDQDGLQRVIEHGDEYQAAIETVITAKLQELSLTNQFANEEVSSNYGYLSGYREPKSIGDQLKVLYQWFPKLGAPMMNERILSSQAQSGSEGLFAIPRWQVIAPTYNQAVELVLEALKKARKGKFYNWRQGELGPDRLRETERKRLAFERLANEQLGHDVLVVAAQFGLRHRGRSVRRARAVMGGREFGLGAFEIGIMLLTHPDRLKHYDDLWIDCAGDEYSPGADGQFESAPFFIFHVGGLKFRTYWFDGANDFFGSASAFFPQ